jgi:hypothetical protein
MHVRGLALMHRHEQETGNIPILSRCIGTTPTHQYRPIGINNDPIVHGVLATSSRRSTIRQFSICD